jgi:hypothetical protein
MLKRRKLKTGRYGAHFGVNDKLTELPTLPDTVPNAVPPDATVYPPLNVLPHSVPTMLRVACAIVLESVNVPPPKTGTQLLEVTDPSVPSPSPASSLNDKSAVPFPILAPLTAAFMTSTQEQFAAVLGAVGQLAAYAGLVHAPGAGALVVPVTFMLPPINEVFPNAKVAQHAIIARAAPK